ncbi:hypothetical protein B7760_05127 [Burkholderia glumae]|uniref:hypothetical protein n=1 Tax=Burkholderia glumae TaxID=337 RepID=UPI00157B60D6|nr:hypothetical protein [Burkholderia glumae]QKM51061.1 hypothetical protein B7760_05127 [Burkholderia glumae]
MDIAGVAHPMLHFTAIDEIDGEILITESRAAAPARAYGIGIDEPPLTLYGAYRQGVSDYFARRPNPYRNGSRLAQIWQEGHVEAASRNAWKLR